MPTPTPMMSTAHSVIALRERMVYRTVSSSLCRFLCLGVSVTTGQACTNSE
jgi:hypothetical protein